MVDFVMYELLDQHNEFDASLLKPYENLTVSLHFLFVFKFNLRGNGWFVFSLYDRYESSSVLWYLLFMKAQYPYRDIDFCLASSTSYLFGQQSCLIDIYRQARVIKRKQM